MQEAATENNVTEGKRLGQDQIDAIDDGVCAAATSLQALRAMVNAIERHAEWMCADRTMADAESMAAQDTHALARMCRLEIGNALRSVDKIAANF